jgi:hypothetical protein
MSLLWQTQRKPVTDNKAIIEFMNLLLEDQQGKDSLNLTPWEQEFLASYNRAHRHWQWMTDPRAEAADRMWRRYGPELNHPHPLDTVSDRRKLADADPDGCEYLVKEYGTPQRRCNDPAEYQEPGRMRYCKLHAETVQEAMKRSGKRIALIKFP